MDFETPQSRNEAILQNILGAENELEPPQSRIEELLQEIAVDAKVTDDAIAELKTALDEMVVVSTTPPTSENNKIWVDSDASSVEIPTAEDLYNVFPTVTVSNQDVAAFTDGANDVPVKAISVAVMPSQSGEGTPTPSNVRPISGWTGTDITVSPTSDTEDGEKYTVSWTEQGTVYGGTLAIDDSGNGTLTAEWAKYVMDGATNAFNLMSDGGTYKLVTKTNLLVQGYNTTPTNDLPTLFCNMYNAKGIGALGNAYIGGYYFRACVDTSFADVAAFNAYLTTHNLEYVYKLSSPVIYEISAPQIKTLLGTNYISADSGKVSVTYRADIGLYIQNALSS